VTHFARFRVAALGCVAAAGVLSLAVWAFRPTPATVSAAAQATGATAYTPTYTKDGDLVPPLQYREWVYLTTGLDMSYIPKASSDRSVFDNVFVNPEAYRAFQATGTWPDKTVMLLEGRQAQSRGSINLSGHFQSGGIVGLEIHIKDEARFPGKWAFFDVASETKATLIPSNAPCYTCHADHAAVDTTFVQFYPTLLPIAQKKGTLSASYLKEAAADTAK
jgi:cytochrome P460